MKKYLLLMAAFFGAGCSFARPGIVGSGKLISRELALGEINQIEASGTFRLDVSQGDVTSIVVTADDNLWDSVDVRNQGGMLILGTKLGPCSNTHLSAKVVVPHLSAIRLTGASRGEIHDLNNTSGRLDLTVSGASKLAGGLRQGQVRLNASGASRATLQGTADAVDIIVSGASHGDLHELASDVARVDLSGASKASVNARQKLSYDLSGASHLSYAGSPAVEHSAVSGASSVSSAQ